MNDRPAFPLETLPDWVPAMDNAQLLSKLREQRWLVGFHVALLTRRVAEGGR